ncbi:hypothetical protein [Actinomycetospora cinnamomea]|uniref:Integral membrane protein n=1 Tax=Actinomycetospora cinnamomea TaxID=663609 RepID=A0A2U1EU27_9PSEU|nr:hypothetical protein [Actinomycetospora cinnamomea]PVZ03438.1 hypothetical protein C8D89_12138 [Actinomycetospora cinnamomea]
MTTTARTTATTTSADTQRGLRAVLRLDAVASGALGVAAAAGAGVLDTLLGLPAALLVGVGIFLVVYATGLVVLAARPAIPRPATWIVVLGNSAWVLMSLGLVAGAWERLTVLGVVVVLAQAAAVAVFADLQYAGLRRR